MAKLHLGLGGSSSYLLRSSLSAKVFIRIILLFGIKYFDPAQLYGDGRGETLLGNSLNLGKNKVVTKIGLLSNVTVDLPASERWGDKFKSENLLLDFKKSLFRLKSKNCFGLLLHCYEAKFDFSSHIDMLVTIKNLGYVQKIGFSVDSLRNFPTDCTWADIIEIPIDLVEKVSINRNQILMINGISRVPEGTNILKRYLSRRHEHEIVILTGTSRLFRFLIFYFNYLKIAVMYSMS